MKRPYFVLGILLALACADLFGQSAPATQLPSGGVVGLPMTPQAGTQQGPRPFANPAQQARFAIVKGYMRRSSPLQIGDQYLAGLGDEAAFFIYNLGIYSPLSAAQTLTALDIIHKSFADPLAIRNGEDRKPRKSLALLKLWQATAVDQTVKERIVVETNFLNAVPQNLVAPPIGIIGPPPASGTTPFN